MSQEGWISIHRQLRECWIWDEKPFDRTHAWIDILLSANHQDKKIMFDGNLYEVERGSFITSVRKLCERWGWSNTKVKRFLDALKNDEMITYKSDTKKTTINVVKYGIYQDLNVTKNDTETSQKHHRNVTETSQKHTNNNDNNDNNDNKIITMSAEQTPYEQIKELFIKNCPTLPVIKTITGERQKVIKTRWKDHPELDFFENLFKLVNESDFLSGRSGKWQLCCFDWIFKPSNMQKILEGNYKNKGSVNNEPGNYNKPNTGTGKGKYDGFKIKPIEVDENYKFDDPEIM